MAFGYRERNTGRSAWAAFQALGMVEKSGASRGEHIRFRKNLNAKGVNGKLSFTDPKDDKKKVRVHSPECANEKPSLFVSTYGLGMS
jgi:hypothetical protein